MIDARIKIFADTFYKVLDQKIHKIKGITRTESFLSIEENSKKYYFK